MYTFQCFCAPICSLNRLARMSFGGKRGGRGRRVREEKKKKKKEHHEGGGSGASNTRCPRLGRNFSGLCQREPPFEPSGGEEGGLRQGCASTGGPTVMLAVEGEGWVQRPQTRPDVGGGEGEKTSNKTGTQRSGGLGGEGGLVRLLPTD